MSVFLGWVVGASAVRPRTCRFLGTCGKSRGRPHAGPKKLLGANCGGREVGR